jgi:hypothetical protein
MNLFRKGFAAKPGKGKAAWALFLKRLGTRLAKLFLSENLREAKPFEFSVI